VVGVKLQPFEVGGPWTSQAVSRQDLRRPFRRSSCTPIPLPAVSLLTDLDGFHTEHRCCGDLDAGVEGEVVWIDCECGARIARRADDGEALGANG
jgi:hypothetical protein